METPIKRKPKDNMRNGKNCFCIIIICFGIIHIYALLIELLVSTGLDEDNHDSFLLVCRFVCVPSIVALVADELQFSWYVFLCVFCNRSTAESTKHTINNKSKSKESKRKKKKRETIIHFVPNGNDVKNEIKASNSIHTRAHSLAHRLLQSKATQTRH